MSYLIFLCYDYFSRGINFFVYIIIMVHQIIIKSMVNKNKNNDRLQYPVKGGGVQKLMPKLSSQVEVLLIYYAMLRGPKNSTLYNWPFMAQEMSSSLACLVS